MGDGGLLRRLLAFMALLAVLAAHGAARADSRHVRVILDTSMSMRGAGGDPPNDPLRLATLSTLLLYDLAEPSLDDSFKVIPFRKDWRSEADWSAPLPVIVPKDRASFARSLSEAELPYDGQMTYFYPGLREAVRDLTKTPSGPSAIRLVVLITDGLPEDPTRDKELGLITKDIVPELEKQHILLYVLAFGHVAADHRSFFDDIVRAGKPDALGEVLIDPTGKALIAHMITIFSHAFGYVEEGPTELKVPWDVGLTAGADKEETALVLFNLAATPPAFGRDRFKTPPGYNPTFRSFEGGADVLQGTEKGASYSLRWLLYRATPPLGSTYQIAAQPDVQAAVLQPTRVEIRVEPAPGRLRADRTMAEAKFTAQAVVANKHGAKGLPPPVEVSFTPCHAVKCGLSAGAPPLTSTISARSYRVETEFGPVPPDREFYEGHLELTARRGDPVVGERRREQAHPVFVHPFVHVKALLPERDAAVAGSTPRALERRERGCATFTLQQDPRSRLPHPGSPVYSVRARVLGLGLDGPLREAQVTLDGLPLTLEKSLPGTPNEWDSARPLPLAELLGEHTACVVVGRPEGIRAAIDVPIPISFTLAESPYDDFDVIETFTLKARVAPPSLIARWGPWLILGLGPVLLLAALWYLRDRPDLPPDLCVAVGPAEGGPLPAGRPPAEGSLVRRLLGLRVDRPVITERGDPLGWVVPRGDQLYSFRPAREIHLFSEGPGSLLQFQASGMATLQVHHLYRAQSPHGDFLFRAEYR